MPIYEYRCVACGREIEVIHGIHAEGPSACDVCGAPMRKLVSPPAIVFRGAGWAKKDARDSSSARSAEASPSEAGTAGSQAEKAPAAEGSSGRDRPPETADKGGAGKAAPGGGGDKVPKSSGGGE